MAARRNLFPRTAVTGALGPRVRKERETRGWTQAELAAAVGVSTRTIIRLEGVGLAKGEAASLRAGAHRPTADLVQAVERALDATKLVPGWGEAANPDLPCYGRRARRARIAAHLTLAAVARVAGVSPATLSRFECELGEPSALVGKWGSPDEGIKNEPYARALGFDDAAAMNAWCMS